MRNCEFSANSIVFDIALVVGDFRYYLIPDMYVLWWENFLRSNFN